MEPQDQLEIAVHTELRNLPELAAPPTLMPRVMAVIQARAALPWWRRSWWDWPAAARTVFAGLVTVSALLLVYFGLPWLTGVTNSASTSAAAQWIGSVVDFVKGLEPLGNALLVLGRAVTAQPVVIAFLAAAAVLYVWCLGLGTMCVRVALRRI